MTRAGWGKTLDLPLQVDHSEIFESKSFSITGFLEWFHD